MSQDGYDKLVAELQRLEAVERPKASAAIAEAADKGDLSENSEYDAAKEAQAHLEAKITEMKMTIAQAKNCGYIAFEQRSCSNYVYCTND